jgi:Cu-processing system ATP-binding protein
LNRNAIEIRDVVKRFGAIEAVAGVDLAVREGELFGLIGHNGAGKSTLFKLMLGLLAPDRGSLELLGEPVGGARFRETRRRIAYLPENVVFYDNLSGLETLRFFADLKGADPSACRPLLAKLGLGGAAHRPVRGYSKGMRQRLGLAQALLGHPRLLFLDEPTAGLDPEAIGEFYRILAELKTQGVTLLLSSHNLAEIQERVDRLALMRRGRIQALGTVQALREALHLPLRIEVSLRPGGAERLRRALAAFPDCALRLEAAGGSVVCDRGRKLALLAALTALSGIVTDIRVHEPSLEDVFLGYTEN